MQGARAFGIDSVGRPRAHRVGARDARRPRPLEGGADPEGDPRGAARRRRAAPRPRPLQLPGARRPRRACATRSRGCAAKLERNEDLDPVDREVIDLYDTLLTYQGVMSGESLHVVPHPDDPKAAWYSIADLATPAGRGPAPGAAGARPHERARRRLPGGRPAGRRDRRLRARQPPRRAGPDRLPDAARTWRWRSTTTASSPTAPPGSSTSSASSPSSRASRSPRAASRGRASPRSSPASSLNTYGMVLRVLISGRPPVTNMYETIVFVAWGGMLFALVFEAIYKVRYFAACAAALSTIAPPHRGQRADLRRRHLARSCRSSATTCGSPSTCSRSRWATPPSRSPWASAT